MDGMGASQPCSVCCLASSYQQSPCAFQRWPYQANPVAFSNTLKALYTAFLAMKSCEATVGAWQRYQKLSTKILPAAQTLPAQLGHGCQISKAKGATSEAALPDLVRAQTLVQGLEIAEVFVKTIKVAGFVLQWLQTPAGIGSVNGVVLGYKTAKVAVKGVKISKGILRVINVRGSTGGNSFDALVRNFGVLRWYKVRVAGFWRLFFGFKASLKAWKAVKLSTSIAKDVFIDRQVCLVDWAVVTKSCKVSENVMSVIEALGALQGGMLSAVSRGYMSIKRTAQGVTVMVKAVTVSKEILILLFSGYGMLRGALKAFYDISEQCEGAEEISIISDCGSKIFLFAFTKKGGKAFCKCRLHSTFGIIEHLVARHATHVKLEKPVFLTSLCGQSAHLSALLSVYEFLSATARYPCEAYSSSHPNPVHSTFFFSPLLSLSYPIL